MILYYCACATGFVRQNWEHGSEAAHSISWEMYHVMNRGDRREAIFADDADRERWLQTLTEACEKTGWEVHAYCVMRNPFHLVIETPHEA